MVFIGFFVAGVLAGLLGFCWWIMSDLNKLRSAHAATVESLERVASLWEESSGYWEAMAKRWRSHAMGQHPELKTFTDEEDEGGKN